MKWKIVIEVEDVEEEKDLKYTTGEIHREIQNVIKHGMFLKINSLTVSEL